MRIREQMHQLNAVMGNLDADLRSEMTKMVTGLTIGAIQNINQHMEQNLNTMTNSLNQPVKKTREASYSLMVAQNDVPPGHYKSNHRYVQISI
eukprot:8711720-Ditylum_brightwellii.AAC.1